MLSDTLNTLNMVNRRVLISPCNCRSCALWFSHWSEHSVGTSTLMSMWLLFSGDSLPLYCTIYCSSFLCTVYIYACIIIKHIYIYLFILQDTTKKKTHLLTVISVLTAAYHNYHIFIWINIWISNEQPPYCNSTCCRMPTYCTVIHPGQHTLYCCDFNSWQGKKPFWCFVKVWPTPDPSLRDGQAHTMGNLIHMCEQHHRAAVQAKCSGRASIRPSTMAFDAMVLRTHNIHYTQWCNDGWAEQRFLHETHICKFDRNLNVIKKKKTRERMEYLSFFGETYMLYLWNLTFEIELMVKRDIFSERTNTKTNTIGQNTAIQNVTAFYNNNNDSKIY